MVHLQSLVFFVSTSSMANGVPKSIFPAENRTGHLYKYPDIAHPAYSCGMWCISMGKALHGTKGISTGTFRTNTRAVKDETAE
jgi:hypothetical protein